MMQRFTRDFSFLSRFCLFIFFKFYYNILLQNPMLPRYMVSPCLSYTGIVSKRQNLGSRKQEG